MDRRADRRTIEHLADEELARRAGGGEREALEVLLRRHQLRVFRICRRLCHSEPDALDATQQALVTVARRIDRYDGRAAFTTWLYRVTTNACLDELRRQRRRVPVLDSGDSDIDERPERDDRAGRARAGDPAELVSDRLALDDALAELAPDFRAAVVLRDVADLDYAEIADVLGVPVGTVRSRIARGRAQLADLLGHPRDGRRPSTGNQDGRDARLSSEVETPTPPLASPSAPPPPARPAAPGHSIGLPETKP